MIWKSALLVMGFIFMCAVSGLAQQPQAGKQGLANQAASNDPHNTLGGPGGDYDFLEKLMDIVSAEIEWSQIAHARTTNDSVKTLSRQTVAEDIPVAQRLVTEAKAKHIKIPNGLTDKYKKESVKLNGLTGDQLDREYVSALINVQHEDVGLLIDEAKASKNPSLVDFATTTEAQVTARNDFARDVNKELAAK